MTRKFDMQGGVEQKKAFLQVIAKAVSIRSCESVFAEKA